MPFLFSNRIRIFDLGTSGHKYDMEGYGRLSKALAFGRKEVQYGMLPELPKKIRISILTITHDPWCWYAYMT